MGGKMQTNFISKDKEKEDHKERVKQALRGYYKRKKRADDSLFLNIYEVFTTPSQRGGKNE